MKKEYCKKCARRVGVDKAGNFVKHRVKKGPKNAKKGTRYPECTRRN